ncbi:alpha/beta fold hydrolase [Streptomyces flaveus]|uniref:Oxidoreductase n=1 Tax=Streptomyces flaveus TaxID=66370 RepID=A0A917QPB2_9ACTN|nr:alpha/beta hydrolase [Streptomyces flaveus]GGK62286.1 oxidoreductase [Streptomyces flaveus]
MSETTETTVLRTAVQVDGELASYLTAGRQDAPPVLMLHGTYWSRVWLPVLDHLADAGLRPLAVDLPGLGRSGGQLTPEAATVPALADWVTRFVSALNLSGPIALAGHDIGGAIAQHLLAHNRLDVSRFALVNSVLYDSWPAPHVAQFRDGDTGEGVLAARRQAITRVLAGVATESLIADYADPWTDERVRRSWMALAGAADNRYTLDLVPALQRSTTPKLLIWGEDDLHEAVEYAERFISEMPRTTLIRIPNADHIPTENAPDQIGRALADFFTA